MPERRCDPSGPYDLRLTLSVLQRGGRDPAFRWADGALWRVFRTPQGTVCLRIGRSGGEVVGEAWGPGAGWALEMCPRCWGRRTIPGSSFLVIASSPEPRTVILDCGWHGPGW